MFASITISEVCQGIESKLLCTHHTECIGDIEKMPVRARICLSVRVCVHVSGSMVSCQSNRFS